MMMLIIAGETPSVKQHPILEADPEVLPDIEQLLELNGYNTEVGVSEYG